MPTSKQLKKKQARAAKKQPKKRVAVAAAVSTLPPDVITELDGSFDMSPSAKSSSVKRHTHYWWEDSNSTESDSSPCCGRTVNGTLLREPLDFDLADPS
jgi:hypothetical protein